MRPVSLIALLIAAGLLLLGILARGQGSERVLSTALIVAASFILLIVAFVWIAVFFNDRKRRETTESEKDSTRKTDS